MKRKSAINISLYICVVLLIINIISIVFTLVNQQSVNVFDLISIIVAIILGISTILQTDQENKTSIQSLEIDIKNHTPFFVINSIVENIENISGYEIRKAQRIDTNFFDSKLYSVDKQFALVGFKKNGIVLIDILMKNTSDILVSGLKSYVYDYSNEKWVENPYVHPVVNMINTTVKDNMKDTYDALMTAHYKELFSNEYSNLDKGKQFVVHLQLDKDFFKYKISELLDLGQTPETLFYKIKLEVVSIYGETYIQEFDIGMRLFAGLYGKEGNSYGVSTYDFWSAYELMIIKSFVSVGE